MENYIHFIKLPLHLFTTIHYKKYSGWEVKLLDSWWHSIEFKCHRCSTGIYSIDPKRIKDYINLSSIWTQNTEMDKISLGILSAVLAIQPVHYLTYIYNQQKSYKSDSRNKSFNPFVTNPSETTPGHRTQTLKYSKWSKLKFTIKISY